MILSWVRLFKRVVCTSFAIILAFVVIIYPAAASSFGSLNMFGFPATSTTTGLTGSGSPGSSATSDNTLSGLSGLTSGTGYLSASTSSVSPSSQYSGFFGTSGNGLFSGVSFAYPTATHDASSVAYASSKAYEATLGNDAVSFPDINVDLGSMSSSFPTISSCNSNVKFAESVQFQLTTESDTMPISGFSFPGVFGSL